MNEKICRIIFLVLLGLALFLAGIYTGSGIRSRIMEKRITDSAVTIDQLQESNRNLTNQLTAAGSEIGDLRSENAILREQNQGFIDSLGNIGAGLGEVAGGLDGVVNGIDYYLGQAKKTK